MPKILRENMRDILFLDIFNQANFKYTPKKDFQLGEMSISYDMFLIDFFSLQFW